MEKYEKYDLHNLKTIMSRIMVRMLAFWVRMIHSPGREEDEEEEEEILQERKTTYGFFVRHPSLKQHMISEEIH